MNKCNYPKFLLPILIFLISLTSCQKDTDLLLDTVLYEDEIAEVVLLARGGNGPDPTANKNADDDGDGIINGLDDCPFTPFGARVNEQGCAASQYDTDEDGVIDSLDQCKGTPAGQSVDANGCSSSQKSTNSDDDGDGVPNSSDSCPNTPSDDRVDGNGCGDSQKDSDGDGVNDSIDQCANTPSGENVNQFGCGASQSDGDNDGITNDKDACPNTPGGESVDAQGCSDSQKDSDNDGVNDALDQCPATPAGASVDQNGCESNQNNDPDDDEDGVPNASDSCPGTPFGESVDNQGCSSSQLDPVSDDDNDGVPNDQDDCPYTPAGETVNGFGCSASQYDTDGDGVNDSLDQCPGTPSGETVDGNGCPENASSKDMGELKAFPGAEGFGKYATGGRGGKVIHVTNLNDSGPGSLREACTTTGARIIVFDVGGTIELSGENSIQIGSTDFNQNTALENITIAGETAPFPGITITGGGLEIYTSNVIIKYLTIRPDIETVEANDAIRIRNWGTGGYNQRNIIIDHVSLSHGSDENFNPDGEDANATLENVTLQNSLLGENSQQNKTMLRGSYVYNLSLLNNFMTEAYDRNPLVGYGANGENMEMINCIVYGGLAGVGISRGNIIDIISNIFVPYYNEGWRWNVISLGSQGYDNPVGTGAIHVSGNFIEGPYQGSAQPYNSELQSYNQSQRVITNSLVNLWNTSKQDIEDKVLPTVGNSLYRDELDNDWINGYYNRNGVRRYDAIPVKTNSIRSADYDIDGDGMADEWERATFGNLDKTAQGNDAHNGYTNIEIFLNSLID